MAAEVEAGFERLDCVGALRMVPQPGRERGILLRWAWRQARPTARCVWLRAVSISLGDGGCRNTLQPGQAVCWRAAAQDEVGAGAALASGEPGPGVAL